MQHDAATLLLNHCSWYLSVTSLSFYPLASDSIDGVRVHDRSYDQTFDGIGGASTAGGMILDIMATGLHGTPQSNLCVFTSLDDNYPGRYAYSLNGKELSVLTIYRGGRNSI